jgi:hypothetical protein
MSVSFKRIVQATALAVPLVVISPQLPAMAADSPDPVVAQGQCDQSTVAHSAMEHCVKHAADLLAQANKRNQGNPAPAPAPAPKPAPTADKPSADKPSASQPAPVASKPADKPAAAQPAPVAGKPADKPAASQPAPVAGKPADKPAAAQPAPVAGKPADKPAAAPPAPAGDKPAAAQPAPAGDNSKPAAPAQESPAPAGAAPAPAANPAPVDCTAIDPVVGHLDACQILDQLGVTTLLAVLGINLNDLPIDLHQVLELKKLLYSLGIYSLLAILGVGNIISGVGIVALLDTLLPVILGVLGLGYLLKHTVAAG